ncbi:MAG: hypothetical protein JXA93_06460 [Anaerolineae bacterium]|nr:hypothetical protein [Anaerolineae bacterium]
MVSRILCQSGLGEWITHHSRYAPHRVALIILWPVTVVAMTAMLGQGVRETGQFSMIRDVLLTAYVAVMLWYLVHSGAFIGSLTDIRPLMFPGRKYGAWIAVLGMILILGLAVLSGAFQSIVLLAMLIAAIWITAAWRREASLHSVVQGAGLAAAAFGACLPLLRNGFISQRAGYLVTPLTALVYIAGGLLFRRTGLGGVQLLEKRFFPALRSFLQGCLLFLPLGLANAAAGSPGSGFTWVREWWMPLWLPWWSAIFEETWFRLFLVGLAYLVLRPLSHERPALAVLAAILFGGVTFGLSHGLTMDRFLTTGLLYGVPFATVFAKRDWEHAVGAHYMVNLIPWLMVFLETCG